MRDIRGETLYFVVLDRFADGDASNNEGRNPATYDPERRDWQRYWGGDLQGVIDRLGYLESIGITTIVITPVVQQMPSLGRDRGALCAAWRGQWAWDYRRIDPHLIPRDEWDRPFGARDTVFDRLVRACHVRGMRLVMQLVVGHTNPGAAGNPRGELLDDGRWMLSFEQDGQGWYRHGLARDGTARDAAEPGPAPFDATSGAFRGWMRALLADWLDRGLDGFYFETANQMPIWFWQETSS
jgi:cyclomaltodextrin glucanotransferase